MSIFAPLLGAFKSRELKDEAREDAGKAERVRGLRETARRGNSLRGLQSHGSWSGFEAGISERLNALHGKLATCKPADLRLLQAQIGELKFVLGIIPRAVEEGQRAEAELNSLEE